jgi:hypothetical protein
MSLLTVRIHIALRSWYSYLRNFLVNDQLDALFLNVFISCLYVFRATSAHHQEDQLYQYITHQSVLYQMMY